MRYILLLLISITATTAAAETWAEINAREAYEAAMTSGTHLICVSPTPHGATKHGHVVWQIHFDEENDAFLIKTSADRSSSGWIIPNPKNVEFKGDLIEICQDCKLGEPDLKPYNWAQWKGVLDRVSGIFYYQTATKYESGRVMFSLDCSIYKEMERKF